MPIPPLPDGGTEQMPPGSAGQRQSFKARLDDFSRKSALAYTKIRQRRSRRRDQLVRSSFAEVIGQSWFWLALTLLLVFPFLDVLQHVKLAGSTDGRNLSSLLVVFLTNALGGFLLSLPVFAAYFWDYFASRRKQREWRDAAAKRRRCLVLLTLIAAWTVLGLLFGIFGV